MKLYTKGGDKGRTSLIGGERVRKTDVRVEAYGTADELQANIAYLADKMAHEECLQPYVEDCRKVCSLLMTSCSLLALGSHCEHNIPQLTDENIERLFEKAFDYETLVDEAVENVKTISIDVDSDLDLSFLGLEVRNVL